jgi:hypothetical protein
MVAGKPLAIDLFCGLGGWTEALLAEGWNVIGYDIERHVYGTEFYPGVLVLQSVLDLHGSMFRNADLIVASPPCQEYSYMAMPWSRGKQVAAALRGEIGEHDGMPVPFPDPYEGSRTVEELNRLFNSCFRIQREACEAAGRHIPMVVENVRGAIPWVGRSAWNYGSFHLWGDVPALMPSHKALKQPYRNFHYPEKYGIPSPSFDGAAHEPSVQNALHYRMPDGVKVECYSDPRRNGGKGAHLTSQAENDRRMDEAIKQGGDWFNSDQAGSISRTTSSRSQARKAASAQIAKIPYALASHIARVYKPSLV